MDIVFMGTPDFAVPCLQALLDAGHRIKAVYTQPDKPKGRGKKLAAPPVKELAQEHNIPVCQPKSLRKAEAAEELAAFEPELCIVVAYGKILPRTILDIPRHGCINVHASLLPLYRGAGPIQWSIIRGESVTGVTTQYMSEGVDEGDVILSMETSIGPEETAGDLHDRLSHIGAEALMKTVELVEQGEAVRKPQAETGVEPTFAPMLDKEMGRLDFSKNAQELHNLIRGLCPWPVAFTQVKGKKLKVYRAASLAVNTEGYQPGELIENKRCRIACGNGTCLELLEVQVEGKKRVSGEDFLRGYHLERKDRFGVE